MFDVPLPIFYYNVANGAERYISEIKLKKIVLFHFQIRSEIVAKMGMKERLTIKSVCSGFLETLSRKKFLRKEFIAFREKFSSEEVEKLKPLGLLQREDVNLSFIDVKSFIDGPKDFWMRWNVKKVRFKGCCINFKLLQQVIENSKNPLEISAIECSFDDSSGWKSRPLAEYDPLLPILESENTPNPKIEKGKIIFHKNVEPYVKRFYDSCNNMFVYCDKGIVQTFVFEFKVRPISNFYKTVLMV